MTVYQVQLLEPKAQALLESLASLNLIRIQKFELPQSELLEHPGTVSQKADPQVSGEDVTQTEKDVHPEKLAKEKPRPRFGSAKGMFVMSPDFDELLENDPSGFGCLKGKIHLAPDWNEPLEDFKEYMY